MLEIITAKFYKTSIKCLRVTQISKKLNNQQTSLEVAPQASEKTQQTPNEDAQEPLHTTYKSFTSLPP